VLQMDGDGKDSCKSGFSWEESRLAVIGRFSSFPEISQICQSTRRNRGIQGKSPGLVAAPAGSPLRATGLLAD